MACRTLVPQPGIISVPSSLGAQSLNHWVSREVPGKTHLIHPPAAAVRQQMKGNLKDPLLPSQFPEHSNPIPPDLHHPGLAVVLRVCSQRRLGISASCFSPPFGAEGGLPAPGSMSFSESPSSDCTPQGPEGCLPGQKGRCPPPPTARVSICSSCSVSLEATAAQATGCPCCQSTCREAIQSHPDARQVRPGQTDRSNPGLGGDS